FRIFDRGRDRKIGFIGLLRCLPYRLKRVGPRDGEVLGDNRFFGLRSRSPSLRFFVFRFAHYLTLWILEVLLFFVVTFSRCKTSSVNSSNCWIARLTPGVTVIR